MSDKLEKLIEKIKILSTKDYYKIKIIDWTSKNSKIKIGGIPYWTPDSLSHKFRREGIIFISSNKLRKRKSRNPFPTNGLIQFFINDDEVIWCQEDYTDQKNFRII